MNRKFPRTPTVLLVMLALCAAAAGAPTPAPSATRDEAQAVEFLYCSAIEQFWSDYLNDEQPGSEAAKSHGQARNLFLAAATRASDADFVLAHRKQVLERMQGAIDSDLLQHTTRMAGESRRCAELFRTRAEPLLKDAPMLPAKP
jgi:hypothetical protein